ncbi:hypothetical protein [Halomonas dongshanensis]|uniref:Uncharacterized protein n=1 Tax=Halomonas dongshanensis TaxID=2890835 RepID=A0ABT2EAU0_9GAMM|nr:hypothetical protein [Halomonas dongshanensis]MCS2608702.1 hypothetical protein [Halomonas dongshanensis]
MPQPTSLPRVSSSRRLARLGLLGIALLLLSAAVNPHAASALDAADQANQRLDRPALSPLATLPQTFRLRDDEPPSSGASGTDLPSLGLAYTALYPEVQRANAASVAFPQTPAREPPLATLPSPRAPPLSLTLIRC